MLFNESLLTQGKLAPGFNSPDPRDYGYKAYLEHIEKGLKDESPVMYGLHPNAEIGYLTSTCESLFGTILRLRVGTGAARGSAESGAQATRDAMGDLLNRLPKRFGMADLHDRSKDAQAGVSQSVSQSVDCDLSMCRVRAALRD